MQTLIRQSHWEMSQSCVLLLELKEYKFVSLDLLRNNVSRVFVLHGVAKVHRLWVTEGLICGDMSLL